MFVPNYLPTVSCHTQFNPIFIPLSSLTSRKAVTHACYALYQQSWCCNHMLDLHNSINTWVDTCHFWFCFVIRLLTVSTWSLFRVEHSAGYPDNRSKPLHLSLHCSKTFGWFVFVINVLHGIHGIILLDLTSKLLSLNLLATQWLT